MLKVYGILHIPSCSIVYYAYGEEYMQSVMDDLAWYLEHHKVPNHDCNLRIVEIIKYLGYSPTIEEFELVQYDL